jgi:SPFH domain / Band 7 family
MLKNRKKLREEVRQKMSEVVQGWGVWLETVEITDVTLVNNQLFRDLQAEFRETKKKDAEIYRMKIEFEINNKKQEFA